MSAATDARASLAAQVTALLRRIIGAPDYEGYLRHVAERHPGCTPLTEQAFLEERLQARYSSPGSRCC
ncbi:MAG TPA: YbdD/YjiX family protein [Gemmatimonadaceae bacterium]|nr:YbdD/YjiX family protein [Gemmatimonadaceae bacterium]